jgi:hypothetical protein
MRAIRRTSITMTTDILTSDFKDSEIFWGNFRVWVRKIPGYIQIIDILVSTRNIPAPCSLGKSLIPGISTAYISFNIQNDIQYHIQCIGPAGHEW